MLFIVFKITEFGLNINIPNEKTKMEITVDIEDSTWDPKRSSVPTQYYLITFNSDFELRERVK